MINWLSLKLLPHLCDVCRNLLSATFLMTYLRSNNISPMTGLLNNNIPPVTNLQGNNIPPMIGLHSNNIPPMIGLLDKTFLQ